jgi:hypothetical protein
MDIESLDHHIKTLTNQHSALEVVLDKIYKQKSWNEFEVERIKKEKLRLKDQLALMHRRRHELMNELDWH